MSSNSFYNGTPIHLHRSPSMCRSSNINITPRGYGIKNGCVISVHGIEQNDRSSYGFNVMNTNITILYIQNGILTRKTFVVVMCKSGVSHFPCTYIGDLNDFYRNIIIKNIISDADIITKN